MPAQRPAALPDGEMLAALGLDRLLPPALAQWRPLVGDGLLHFLHRLPEARLAEMIQGQLDLGAGAEPGRRLAALFSLSPTLHKLGQVVARHQRLPAEVRAHLRGLESMPATVDAEAMKSLLRAELGGDPPVALADAALAEGSIAVVFPFAWEEEGRLRHGVFKMLKPGVEKRLAEELSLFSEVADFLAGRSRQLGLPDIDYRDLLAGVEHLLRREIRLAGEQANLLAAARFYRDDPQIWIPELLPWCTPRLTAMERVFGSKADEAGLSARQRSRMAGLMVTALLARPFWSERHDALFHGDLHGGNLLVADDGRLAVLDWSLTATLLKSEREALVNVALGGLTLDAARIRRALAVLGGAPAEHPALAAAVEAALDRLVLARRPPGFAWLLGILDDLALRGAAAFREEFTLFRKSWLSLSALLGDLAAGVSPDPPLFAVGMERFLAEAPARLFAHPRASGFSTHVSNAELLAACASSWLAGPRWWARFARLAAFSPARNG